MPETVVSVDIETDGPIPADADLREGRYQDFDDFEQFVQSLQ